MHLRQGNPGSFVFGRGGQSGGFGMLTLFFGIGAMMLLLGIPPRHAALDVEGGSFPTTGDAQVGVAFAQWRWKAGEVEEVRVGDSGTKSERAHAGAVANHLALRWS